MRTKSGRTRTTILGNPEIRFQANESVSKTINNNIRYEASNESKANYSKELEAQILERRDREQGEKVTSLLLYVVMFLSQNLTAGLKILHHT